MVGPLPPSTPTTPFRRAFDAATTPYAARNALGITGTGGGGGGGGAPADASYITASSDPTLTNELVLTNTATVTWDFTTPGQAKANTAAGGGNVSNSGTPSVGQYAKWVTATTIQGVAPATVLSDIGGAPLDAQYIVAVNDPTLTNDRVLTDTGTVIWDLATAGQVKANVTSANQVFYCDLTDAADVATYKRLLLTPSTHAETSASAVCTGTTTDFLIASFITDPGVPGAIEFPPGSAYRRLYGSVSGGAARFRLQVYGRTTGGVETLARDETSNNFSDTVATLQEWLATPSSGGTLAATDRIVVKVSARRISGPTNVTVTLYSEGTAHASQIQTTITSGQSAPISATPPLALTGGNLTIDLSGYQPLDADLTAIAALTGTNTIYYRSAANTWSAVTFSGLTFSGGVLTATASGGTPGGATTQVQYNNAGAFGGSANMVWNNATSVLTLTGQLTVSVGSATSVLAAGTVEGASFRCAGGVAVLGPASAGVVALRPSGIASTSGQMTVSSTGAVTVNGTIELGAATDTTLSRVSAGVVSIEGQNILTAATGQPLDADLTSLAAASGTNSLYYRRIADTWDPVTIGSGLAFASGTLSASGGGSAVSSVPQEGRLTYVSATALKFAPYAGNKIKINGTVMTIPNAGITGLGNTGVFVNGTGASNLAASTVYWIYAFSNAGTVTADFRTASTHATSSTAGNEGVEIRTADDTRTLIGLCRTNASSQFVSSASQIFVRSWFNERPLVATSTMASQKTTTSGTPVSLDTSSEYVEFLILSGDAVTATVSGTYYANSSVYISYASIGFNGTTNEGFVGQTNVTYMPFSYTVHKSGLAEGYNYATQLGWVGSGGALTAYYGYVAPDFNRLQVRIN